MTLTASLGAIGSWSMYLNGGGLETVSTGAEGDATCQNNGAMSYFFTTIVHYPFCVLKHFLSPQFEEVIRIRIEFEAILSVITITV